MAGRPAITAASKPMAAPRANGLNELGSSMGAASMAAELLLTCGLGRGAMGAMKQLGGGKQCETWLNPQASSNPSQVEA